MAGTLVLNSRSAWIPSSGLFSEVTSRIYRFLKERKSESASILRLEDDEPLCIDLTETAPFHFNAIREALHRIINEEFGELVSTPENRVGRIKLLQALIDLYAIFSIDPRATPLVKPFDYCQLWLTRDVKWRCSKWLIELTIRALAVCTWENHRQLHEALRGILNDLESDCTSSSMYLNSSQVSDLAPYVEELHKQYRVDHAARVACQEFEEALFPALDELRNLFQALRHNN